MTTRNELLELILAATGGTIPSTVIEVNESSDIDDLANLGVVEIAANTFFWLKNSVVISSRFNITGSAQLHISAIGGVSTLTYSGTDTFISGTGSFRNEGFANLISNSGSATFMNLTGGTFNATNSSLQGWNDLGVFNTGNFFLRVTSLVNWNSGFTLNNCRVVGVLEAGTVTSPTNEDVFTYVNDTQANAVASFLGVPGTLDATTNLLNIDSGILDSTRISVSNSTLSGGSLFNSLGLDQTDPKVLAKGNSNFTDSMSSGSAYVNDNNTVNGAIVNGTFTDMVFGTGGGGMIASANIERWTLIDPLSGILEYIGLEPFNGTIEFSFTALSSGSAQEFRFKFLHDLGAGYVDLADNVETMNEIGGSASNTSGRISLNAVTGDRVKPQITRTSGSSGVTIRYAQISITE